MGSLHQKYRCFKGYISIMSVKIILSTNEKYAGPTAVTIQSVIENCNPSTDYSFFILHSGLSNIAKSKLESMQTKNVSISFIDLSEKIGAIASLGYGHLTRETLFRLYIPELFSKESKILYMDVDMVALDDVAKLYEIDLGDNYIAAAPDTGAYDTVEHNNSFMSIAPGESFNAGLILFNIEMFKNACIKEKCIELLMADAELKNKKLTYMDQDALNIVCKDHVKFFDMSWNVQPIIKDQALEKTIVNEKCRRQYEEALMSPKLIHYTGKQKPWLYAGILCADYFWNYARKTAFYKEIRILQKEELDRLSLRYPYWNIKYDGRIVIYGAGYQGIKLRNTLHRSKYANVLMMVDKNNDGVDVKSINEIKRLEFDQVIIAVENENAVIEIHDDLIGLGVEETKIVWLFERNSPWKKISL